MGDFPLLSKEAGSATEAKASGAGPSWRGWTAGRAAPVEQTHYAKAGFWFRKLCVGSLALAAWGNALRGAPNGRFIQFFS